MLSVNAQLRRMADDRSKGRMARVRSGPSNFILSGGLMVCTRCGANMVGHRSRGHTYYVCGTHQYRRGLGCGSALYVRQAAIEGAVVEEVGRRFEAWSDVKRLTALANEELLARQQQLGTAVAAPQLTPAQVEGFRREFSSLLAHGTNEEKRLVMRTFVKSVEVDPSTGDIVAWLYERPPDPANGNAPSGRKGRSHNGLVAGAGFVDLQVQGLGLPLLERECVLPTQGRRTRALAATGTTI